MWPSDRRLYRRHQNIIGFLGTLGSKDRIRANKRKNVSVAARTRCHNMSADGLVAINGFAVIGNAGATNSDVESS
jgi:hypothetical protein